jgi:hypothetical protein
MCKIQTGMIKLTDINTRTGFTDSKDARNLADWLRADRAQEPEKIDGELAYAYEFVCQVLTKRLERIGKRYPDSLEAVQNFIDNEKQIIRPQPSVKELAHINEPDVISTHEIPISSSNEIEAVPEIIPDTEPPSVTRDALRERLTSSRTMLWGTMFVIGTFLPFTALNLIQYISIKPESIYGQFAVGLLCWAIAAIWDFSILLFAVNGKALMAKVGAFVMFVFVAAKFDFIADIFGAYAQLMFVKFCIVSYTPLLVEQFTRLAVKK